MYPADTHEEAVEAGLRTFRASSRELLDRVIVADPEPGQLARLGELSEGTGAAALAVLRRWRHLDLDSPYRQAALEELDERLSAIVAEGALKPALVGEALELEPELERVVTVRSAAMIGDALRDTRGDRKLRETAEAVGLSPGRLSELERGHRGVPVELTARKLDHELRAGVIPLRREWSSRVHELREIAEGRRAYLAGHADDATQPSSSARTRSRLQGVIEALSADEHLLEPVEAFLHLPRRARLAVGRMVQELRSNFEESE